jgi:hypothetical protein
MGCPDGKRKTMYHQILHYFFSPIPPMNYTLQALLCSSLTLHVVASSEWVLATCRVWLGCLTRTGRTRKDLETWVNCPVRILRVGLKGLLYD